MSHISVIRKLVAIQDPMTYARIWYKLNSWEFPEELLFYKPDWWDGNGRDVMMKKMGYSEVVMSFCEINCTEEDRIAVHREQETDEYRAESERLEGEAKPEHKHLFRWTKPITDLIKKIK